MWRRVRLLRHAAAAGCMLAKVELVQLSEYAMSSPDRGDHILVIDDDPTICRLLSDVLTDEGYTVAVASGGFQALAAIEERVPGLLLLDMRMSGMDGPELVAALRARGIAIPVI